jgi:hypothetical protein
VNIQNSCNGNDAKNRPDAKAKADSDRSGPP